VRYRDRCSLDGIQEPSKFSAQGKLLGKFSACHRSYNSPAAGPLLIDTIQPEVVPDGPIKSDSEERAAMGACLVQHKESIQWHGRSSQHRRLDTPARKPREIVYEKSCPGCKQQLRNCCCPPKRPRGRPRKNVVPVVAEEHNSLSESSISNHSDSSATTTSGSDTSSDTSFDTSSDSFSATRKRPVAKQCEEEAIRSREVAAAAECAGKFAEVIFSPWGEKKERGESPLNK
jgi:hypothetical protein